MSPAKVVHLSSVHPLDDSRIFYKECRELAQAGYEVYLIACGQEGGLVDGVHVIDVTRAGNRLQRMVVSAWHDYRRAARIDGQLYHLHDPELIPYGLLLRFRGKRVVYDAHEDLPLQILSKPWIPEWLRRPLSGSAALGLRLAASLIFSAVVTAEPSVAIKFPRGKTVLVQNFPVLKEFSGDGAAPYADRPPLIANIGGISAIRCIREMVAAIDLLADSDARLILGGKFASDALFQEVSHYPGWRRVEFQGWMSRDQVRDTLIRVRAGLVLLYPEPTYVDAWPIKLFEYMAMSLPVVAANFPLHREIVEGYSCGLCVDPLNPQEIAAAIRWLLDNPDAARKMGENGRRAVEERFNWADEGKKLRALYKRLLP